MQKEEQEVLIRSIRLKMLTNTECLLTDKEGLKLAKLFENIIKNKHRSKTDKDFTIGYVNSTIPLYVYLESQKTLFFNRVKLTKLFPRKTKDYMEEVLIKFVSLSFSADINRYFCFNQRELSRMIKYMLKGVEIV